MLLNGGALLGRRILSPRSVELMRSNHLGSMFRGLRGNEEGMGFGLSVAITLDETKTRWRRSNGSAGWEGAFGTQSWSDPREEIIGVIMLQQSVPQVQADFNNAVMQAITQSNPPR
jgi:CubicO group peptidase (beta-lactamase class C family)